MIYANSITEMVRFIFFIIKKSFIDHLWISNFIKVTWTYIICIFISALKIQLKLHVIYESDVQKGERPACRHCRRMTETFSISTADFVFVKLQLVPRLYDWPSAIENNGAVGESRYKEGNTEPGSGLGLCRIRGAPGPKRPRPTTSFQNAPGTSKPTGRCCSHT